MSPRQPMQRRMKAAIEAAPYTHLRLAVTAVIDGAGNFATRLDLACGEGRSAADRSPPGPGCAGSAVQEGLRLPISFIDHSKS